MEHSWKNKKKLEVEEWKGKFSFSSSPVCLHSLLLVSFNYTCSFQLKIFAANLPFGFKVLGTKMTSRKSSRNSSCFCKNLFYNLSSQHPHILWRNFSGVLVYFSCRILSATLLFSQEISADFQPSLFFFIAALHL